MEKPHDATIRRARLRAKESYALSKAVYSAKPEDRLYWQRNARLWRALLDQSETCASPAVTAALDAE